MSHRFLPQDVLRLVRTLEIDNFSFGEIMRFSRPLHVCFDKLSRKEKPSPKEERDADEALNWFSYWYFEDRQPAVAELFEIVEKQTRIVAKHYGRLADAAAQYQVSAQPFLQTQSLMIANLEGIGLPVGESLQAQERDACRLLNEAGIGLGGSGVLAAAKQLREAALQRRSNEIRDLSPRVALRLLEQLNETIEQSNALWLGFLQKWEGRKLSETPIAQRREYEIGLKQAKDQHGIGEDAKAERLFLMEHIAAFLPSFGIDATPVQRWILFMGHEAQLYDLPDSLTEAEARKIVKGWEQSCELDMSAVSAALTACWYKVESGQEPRTGGAVATPSLNLPTLTDVLDAVTDIAMHVKEIKADFKNFRLQEAHEQRQDQSPYYFRRSGTTWEIRFGTEHGHFPDLKGFGIIGKLLRFPDPTKALTAEELLGRDAGESSPEFTEQPQLDSEGIKNLEDSLKEKDADIQKARGRGDDVKARRLERERDQIRDYLKKVKGIGGRPRAIGPKSASGSARVAVKQNIDRALEEIKPTMPRLFEHLKANISTGTECDYRPTTPLNWQFD